MAVYEYKAINDVVIDIGESTPDTITSERYLDGNRHSTRTERRIRRLEGSQRELRALQLTLNHLHRTSMTIVYAFYRDTIADTDKADELPFDIINLLRAFLGDYASAQMEKSSKEIIECVQSHGMDPLICEDNVFRIESEERWHRQQNRETMFYIMLWICFPCEFIALIIFNIAYLLTCACCWLDLSRVTGF